MDSAIDDAAPSLGIQAFISSNSTMRFCVVRFKRNIPSSGSWQMYSPIGQTPLPRRREEPLQWMR